MGRKKLGGGGGGGGGAPTKRPGGSHGSGLVVVNPMLMQSALRQSASPAAKPTPGKKRKAPADSSKQQQKQHKKLKQQSPGNSNSSSSSSKLDKPDKRPQKNAVVSTTVQSAVTSARDDDDADTAKRRTPVALLVARDEQLLAGAYWVALSRAAKRSCVVVVPNSHATLTPQFVAGVLRHLGFQAIAIHKKMTPGQRKESVERLASAARLASEASQVLLVTTEHFAGAALCADADVLLVGVAAQESFSKFAAVFQVSSTGGGGASSYRPELTSALMQQLGARLKLATQITEIAQRLGQTNAKDVDAKWANKLARGADLGDDDDDADNTVGDNDEDGGGRSSKKKKKKALSPDEQRLQALTEKLTLLIARKLEAPSAKKSAAGSDVVGAKETAISTPADTQNGKEKLEALGIVTLNAAVGAALTDERFSAQTRWMDAARGQQYGGAWDGEIRHGASKDAASLALRQAFCAHLRSHKDKKSSNTASSPATRLLHEWKPNRQPADVDKWGGEFGKACGHNEVVMQALRPFFPQEVLNSRVCSRLFPAPGNQGFDGCLEHLRLQCLAQQRAMTLWDAESFVFISRAGQVTWTKKHQLLQGLSLAGLQCLVANLRSWTLACDGAMAPSRVLQALQLCCALAGGEQTTPRLEVKLLKRVMSFAVGGSARLWKQIARVPALESEVVYAGEAC